jgi:hypothetical protein
MGNTASEYNSIEDNETLPEVKNFHRKGKPYDIILKSRLNNNNPTVWGYYVIYDLRNGVGTWRLDTKIYGDEIDFRLHLIEKDKITETIDLRYSSKSSDYITILKGCNVELELYSDNIHSQRLYELFPKNKFSISGFIKFDNQDKIKIAFLSSKTA